MLRHFSQSLNHGKTWHSNPQQWDTNVSVPGGRPAGAERQQAGLVPQAPEKRCASGLSPRPSLLPHRRWGTKPEDRINKSTDAASAFHSLPLMNNRGQPPTSSRFSSPLNAHTYRDTNENTQGKKLRQEYEYRSQIKFNLRCQKWILSLTSFGQETTTTVSVASNRRGIRCWSTLFNTPSSHRTTTKLINLCALGPVLAESPTQ